MKQKQSLALLIVFLVFGVLTFYVIRSYIPLALLAFVTATIANPIYQKVLKKFKGKELFSSVIVTAGLILVVVIPFILLFWVAISQLANVIGDVQQKIASGEIDLTIFEDRYDDAISQLTVKLEDPNVDKKAFADAVVKSTDSTMRFIGENVIPAVSSVINLVMGAMIFFFIVIFMFPARKRILQYLVDVTPLKKDFHLRFYKRFESITRLTFFSTIASMFVAGFANGFILWVIDFPNVLFWSLLLFFGSIIPYMAGAIVFGLGLFLLLSGNIMEGAVLLLWSSLVAGNLDSLIRIKILRKDGEGLPDLLTLLSVIGGIQVFGPLLGFLYGPIIASFFYTAALLYQEEKKRKEIKSE
ncbi:AI-2E family transporter [Patescibacteria group bacterium]